MGNEDQESEEASAEVPAEAAASYARLRAAQKALGPPDCWLTGSSWRLPAHKDLLKVMISCVN